MIRIQRGALLAIVLFATLSAGGCFRRTFVVVPQRSGAYSARDTLYGVSDGRNVRVTFRRDTIWRVDTLRILRTDTLWRGGTRYIRDTVRVLGRRDTLYLPLQKRDTLYLPDPRRGRDTVYLPRPGTGRVDTVRMVLRDTVFVPRVGSGRRDTVRIVVHDTVYVPRIGSGRRDTVRVGGARDTIRLTVHDTIRVIVRDTVRIMSGGRRLVFVPPGQFPPPGQCRVWIFDRAPGQQARAAACDQLGPIPAGAFVLFDGTAWDMDHDWAAEARNSPVPAEIAALKRRGAP